MSKTVFSGFWEKTCPLKALKRKFILAVLRILPDGTASRNRVDHAARGAVPTPVHVLRGLEITLLLQSFNRTCNDMTLCLSWLRSIEWMLMWEYIESGLTISVSLSDRDSIFYVSIIGRLNYNVENSLFPALFIT